MTVRVIGTTAASRLNAVDAVTRNTATPAGDGLPPQFASHLAADATEKVDRQSMFSMHKPSAAERATAEFNAGSWAAAAGNHEAAAAFHARMASNGPGWRGPQDNRPMSDGRRKLHRDAARAHAEAARAARLLDPAPHAADPMSAAAAAESGKARNVEKGTSGYTTAEGQYVPHMPAVRARMYKFATDRHLQAATAHRIAKDKATEDGDRDRELHHEYSARYHEAQAAALGRDAENWTRRRRGTL